MRFIVMTRWVIVITRNIPMVPHAPKVDVLSIIKSTVERILPIMPLTTAKSVVTTIFKNTAHHDVIRWNALPCAFQIGLQFYQA